MQIIKLTSSPATPTALALALAAHILLKQKLQLISIFECLCQKQPLFDNNIAIFVEAV